MDQPKDIKPSENAAAPEPQMTPEISAVPAMSATEMPSIAAAKSELPIVESPSISPADLVKTGDSDLEPASAPIPELTIDKADAKAGSSPFADEEFTPLPLEPKRAWIRPRHKRYALLAASVAIAAALGGVIGALATGGPATPPVNVAAQEEAKAMQHSMAKLAKEVTTLKANLDAANKRAQIQTASLEKKLHEQSEQMKKESDVTGSISAPQTTTPAATPATAVADVPTPRPAPLRVATANVVPPAIPASVQPVRPAIIRNWSIRGASNGYVYVQGQFGDVYQIVPGAPLPGLGPVESIRRLDGRWVVQTPKGIIVSMRDRRYFE